VPSSYKVLVLGGYGFFGARLVRRLARHAHFDICIAGRSAQRAQVLADTLTGAPAKIRIAALDIHDAQLAERIKALEADAVVHTAGPFQGQDYVVAQACIEAGAHYIDLADGRNFVAGIGALNEAAQQAGVLVVSGASSVPALSGCVVDHLSEGLALAEIDIGICPGNRTDRGIATLEAILSYCGKAFRIWQNGNWTTVHGWTAHWSHRFPAPVGKRRLTHCDVPDLELFPQRYPGVRSVRFGAGMELGLLHWGLSLLAWLCRLRIVRNLQSLAPLLLSMSNWVRGWGGDTGGMHVTVRGRDASGATLTRNWYLIAADSDGPYVPTLAAAALLYKLADGAFDVHGAMPCLGLISLEEFRHAAAGLAIEMGVLPYMS